MKNWVTKILLLGVASVMLWSCEKDEDRAIISPTTAPTFTADTTALTLSQATGAANALTITWTSADFGYPAGISYSLQMSKKGTNFASASTTEISLGSKPGTRTFTEKEINGELLKAFGADITSDAEFRIRAAANNLSGGAVQSVYSNVIDMVVRPFRDIILYTFPDALYVAGNYQNWSPETAPQLVRSSSTSNVYEGFINFNNATPEFKFVKGNNWGAGDYGSAGGANLGNGGPNLSLGGGAGLYYVKADVGAMNWYNYKITTWGLIGSATPNGWNNPDQDMTYNASTKIWTITLNLVAGDIKFRANDDWAVNLGDNNKDGKPEINGANIPIATAGNYTINLDLETGGNWFYTIKKN
jgi:starch-binding outer membrane protein SusE/F